jgi:hypothetical protein
MTERDIHAQELPPFSSCPPVSGAPDAQIHDPPLSPLSSCLIYLQLRFPSIERGLWCVSSLRSSPFCVTGYFEKQDSPRLTFFSLWKETWPTAISPDF